MLCLRRTLANIDLSAGTLSSFSFNLDFFWPFDVVADAISEALATDAMSSLDGGS